VTPPFDEGAVARLLQTPPLRRLLAILDADGEEARVVGGAVRNALIGRPVHEIDLATTAPPDVVTARAETAGFKAVPTGLEHGTVTVVVAHRPFEVTTLREDVATDGRRATVRFGRDFALDARRRDFTINALSASRDGRVHDYCGGLDDLAAGRVRFIGDPTARIREDYLRILRFFRFHADYGEGPLDRDGLEAAVRERAGIAVLSRERIRAELLKLVAARHAPPVVAAALESGLLSLFLGGVGDVGRLARAAAWEQRQGLAPDAVRRLAALAVVTPEDAERLRDRLRLANEEHERLSAIAAVMTQLKSLATPVDAIAMRRLVGEHGVALLSDALAIVAGEPRPVLEAEALDALERFRSGAEPAPVFPFRGADLVRRGVPKGPRIGELLAQARQRWLAAGCPANVTLEALIGPALGEAT
jgi:poly(A) polymerase